jgi:hypothetical protein
MEDLDKDYIKYLRESGKGEEAIFLYLEHLCDVIDKMKEMLGMDNEEGNKDLMGMFKIQPQSDKGARKGPPPVII